MVSCIHAHAETFVMDEPTFGVAIYFNYLDQIIEQDTDKTKWPMMLKELDEDIRAIHDASWKYQGKIFLCKAVFG